MSAAIDDHNEDSHAIKTPASDQEDSHMKEAVVSEEPATQTD